MSTSSESRALDMPVRQFIESMHRLGATRVQVGDIVVEFGTAADELPAPPPVEMTEEERQKAHEMLLFASSD